MRVFGCAWKINFPEVIWSWPCKMRLWPRKWFETQIFTSNHFRVRIARRERERERESPDHAFDVAGEPQAPVWQSHALDLANRTAHHAARSRLRSILPPLDLAFDPLISLYDFDFCCCGGVVVVFWWLWLLIAEVCCRGLNWSFGGVWCWDLAVICSVD